MLKHDRFPPRGPMAGPAAPATINAMTDSTHARAAWLAPAGLILLSLVPMVAGTVRIAELADGSAARTDENARFFDQPLPVILHIVAASVYLMLGAFQFSPSLRRRRIGWHRATGRLLVPLGLVAALTGLWMTFFYDVPPIDEGLLKGFRLMFGAAMVAAIVLGFAAVRRRDIQRHSAWMIRAYAIGLGAGTQVLTFVPWVLLAGEPGKFARAMLMAAGWVINLAVAEWVIHRSRRVRTPRPGLVRAA